MTLRDTSHAKNTPSEILPSGGFSTYGSGKQVRHEMPAE